LQLVLSFVLKQIYEKEIGHRRQLVQHLNLREPKKRGVNPGGQAAQKFPVELLLGLRKHRQEEQKAAQMTDNLIAGEAVGLLDFLGPFLKLSETMGKKRGFQRRRIADPNRVHHPSGVDA
jgi:hypothetical protein